MVYEKACALNVLQLQPRTPMLMPEQRLFFAGHQHHWQDIILGVYNPLVMTALMKTKLLQTDYPERVFDDMRNEFNYRHEFAFTKVEADLADEDLKILRKLGIQSNSKP